MRIKKGFTLVEVMIAVMIMSTSLLLLANSWSGAFMRTRKTQQAFEVSALLQRKMAEIEIEYRDKPIEEIPEEKEDNFGDEYPQYSWRLTSKKLEIPDMTSSLFNRDGGVDETTLMLVKQLSETLSKSVKEVTVTVVLTPKTGKTLNYSVTTYFVDYDKPLNLGVPGGAN